ncbi:MAG: hypothetical protein DI582_03190 [Azospirillum brasilense]|nr:MAG: hypothetical protein DI582_03190 [Azospirillum brasilense]
MTEHTDKLSSRASLRDDPPVALAKRAIKLLEAKIRQEFDLELPLGVELEFGVLSNQRQHKASPAEQYGVPDALGKISNHTASAYRHPKNRDAWFPESRRVAYSYREESNDDRWDMMEVVLTHEPRGQDGTRLPIDALATARAVEALRHQLHQPSSGYMPRKHGAGIPTAQLGVRYWQQQRRDTIDMLVTEAVVPGTFNSHGMHLNMSLVDASTQENVMLRSGLSAETVTNMLRQGIGAVQMENLWLVCPHRRSMERQSMRMGPISDVMGRVKNKRGQKDYVENSLPGADCNPYYAIMLQLAGTYLALKEAQFGYDYTTQQHVLGNPDYAQDLKAPQPGEKQVNALTLNDLQANFRAGSHLRDALDACEPGLGDAFHHAIEQTPPGYEKSGMDKLQKTRRTLAPQRDR